MQNNSFQTSHKKLTRIISKNVTNTASMLDTIGDVHEQLQMLIQNTIIENLKLKTQQLQMEAGLVEDKTMITRLHQEIIELKARLCSNNQKDFNTDVLESSKNLFGIYQKRIEILDSELYLLKQEKIDNFSVNIKQLINTTVLENNNIADLYTTINSNLTEIKQMLNELIYNNNIICAKNCEEKVSVENKALKEKFEQILVYKNGQITAQDEIIKDLKKSIKLAMEEKMLLQESVKKDKEKHKLSNTRSQDEIHMLRNRLRRIEVAKAYEVEGYQSEIRLLKDKYKNIDLSK